MTPIIRHKMSSSAAMPRERLRNTRQPRKRLPRTAPKPRVSMAPDEDVRKIADEAMTRLNSLQGAEFDTAFGGCALAASHLRLLWTGPGLRQP